MAKLSISKAWDETKAVLAHDGKLLSTIALALLVLPGTLVGTIAPGTMAGTMTPSGSVGLLLLVVTLIGLLARLALARLALGGRVSVQQAISHGLRRLLPAAAAFLAVLFPVMLFLVPILPAIMANPQNPPPQASLAMLAVIAIGFVLGVRLLTMVIPAAMSEEGGPIALMKRSWTMTKGHWWRLLGFVLLFFIAALVAARAVNWVLGSALIVATGEIEPMSVSALVLSLTLSLVGTAFTTIFTVMLARIYAQLAGRVVEPSVPSSRD